MEEKLRRKIKEIVEERGLSVLGISDNQAQNRRLNRQINEGCAITLPTVFDILVKFPDISSEWLLRDEGRKYISDIPSDGDSEQVLDLKAEITRLRAERDELRKGVEELRKGVEPLRQEVIELRAINRYQEKRLDKLAGILREEPQLSIAAEKRTDYITNPIIEELL
jgi:hypothetical protein